MNIRRLEKLLVNLTAILLFFSLSACNESDDDNPIPAIDWNAELKLESIVDTNEASEIVEVFLEAIEVEVELRPGIKTRMFTYNGIMPGPLIEAKVGDTLVVHFTNNLSEPTTIHWHGVELPALMDGSHISQEPVAENGGTFTYEFKLLKAATYWYHPHIQTHRQIERGLYGTLLVRDPGQDKRLALPEKELVLMLDDILLDEAGQVQSAYPSDPVGKADIQINGREGNEFLVNGRVWPVTVDVEIGEPIRMRLINAANARFFRVDVPGHLLFRIGGDAGLIDKPIPLFPINSTLSEQNSLLKTKLSARDVGDVSGIVSDQDLTAGVMLVPGERAEVVFTPQGQPGEYIYLMWHDFLRGKHGIIQNGDGSFSFAHGHSDDGTAQPQKLVRLRLNGSSDNNQAYIPPISLATTQEIDITNPDGILPVTFGHGMPDENGNISFFATMVDGVGKPFDELTEADALQANVGGTYIWEVANMTEGDHPFHPHGFRFQLLETEYVDLDSPENNVVIKAERVEDKDTIRVPGRPGNIRGRSWTVMRMATKFDDNGREGLIAASGKQPSDTKSGGWVVHCHILEHADRGMMTFLNLYD